MEHRPSPPLLRDAFAFGCFSRPNRRRPGALSRCLSVPLLVVGRAGRENPDPHALSCDDKEVPHVPQPVIARIINMDHADATPHCASGRVRSRLEFRTECRFGGTACPSRVVDAASGTVGKAGTVGNVGSAGADGSAGMPGSAGAEGNAGTVGNAG